MTSLQFRSSPERVGAFRELLQNSTFAEAIVCLRDERPNPSVPAGSDALESVRALARLEQHDTDVNLLLSLAEPLPTEPVEEDETWGVDRSKFPASKN